MEERNINDVWDELSDYDTNNIKTSYEKFDTITINGNTGVFSITLKTQPKVKNEKGYEIYKKENLDLGEDNKLEITILAVNRRKAQMKDNEGRLLKTTAEYTDRTAPTMFYDYTTRVNSLGTQVGVSKDVVIPEQLDNKIFKKVNFIYAIWQNRVVKLELKGGSVALLKTELEDVCHYFDYLKQLKEENIPLFSIQTILTPTKYPSPLGEKYTIDFQRGERITNEEEIGVVKKEVKEISTYLKNYDNEVQEQIKEHPAYDQMKVSGGAKTSHSEAKTATNDTDIDIETGGVNPDDIPF